MKEVSFHPHIAETSKTEQPNSAIYVELPDCRKNDKHSDLNSNLERIPNKDCYNGSAQLKAVKMPTPTEITKTIAVIPVILETGKQILIGIFDIRDVWNERSGSKEHNLQAVVLPDDLADKILANRLDTEI